MVRFGLVGIGRDGELDIPDRLRWLVTAPGEGDIDVTRLLLDVASSSDLEWPDFDHVADDRDHIETLVKDALDSNAPGINILLYGPLGTGKTEFCKVLVGRVGATLYSVGETDEEGYEPSRGERLQDLRLAQRLLADDRRSLLLFDEMEDVLEDSVGGFGFFGPPFPLTSRRTPRKSSCTGCWNKRRRSPCGP